MAAKFRDVSDCVEDGGRAVLRAGHQMLDFLA
jgi:hypothetical protein